jgi:hypothetical protein
MTRKRTSDKDLVVSAAGAPAAARRKASTRPRGQRDAAVTPIAPVTEPETLALEAQMVVAVYTPTHEEIAKLAYSYWEARGYQGGSPEDDWARAERELGIAVSAAVA